MKPVLNEIAIRGKAGKTAKAPLAFAFSDVGAGGEVFHRNGFCIMGVDMGEHGADALVVFDRHCRQKRGEKREEGQPQRGYSQTQPVFPVRKGVRIKIQLFKGIQHMEEFFLCRVLFLQKFMCKSRIVENRSHILLRHNTSGKKSKHPFRDKNAVIVAVFFLCDTVENRAVEKQAVSGRDIQSVLVDFDMDAALQHMDKLNFLVPVQHAEALVGGSAHLAVYIQNQQGKRIVVVGVVRIDGNLAVRFLFLYKSSLYGRKISLFGCFHIYFSGFFGRHQEETALYSYYAQ